MAAPGAHRHAGGAGPSAPASHRSENDTMAESGLLSYALLSLHVSGIGPSRSPPGAYRVGQQNNFRCRQVLNLPSLALAEHHCTYFWTCAQVFLLALHLAQNP